MVRDGEQWRSYEHISEHSGYVMVGDLFANWATIGLLWKILAHVVT
jgi:hypothetical protein